MTSILNMHFPSSDEEDENYNVEEINKETKKKKIKKNKAVEDAIKNSILKEKIEKAYEEINDEYIKLYKHESIVQPNDFLLQFHKKYPQLEKNNNTYEKLFNHLKKYTPSNENEINNINIRELKEKCRNSNKDNNISKVVKDALVELYDHHKVDIEKKYMYAGKIYVIKKKIDKSSGAYKRYLKSKDQIKLGGMFKNIDQIVDNMKQTKQINTVDKSTEDWKNFKIANAIDEEELKSKHNYIDNQIFAENVERKLFENQRKKKNL